MRRRRWLFVPVRHGLLLVWLAVTLLPIYWMLITSLKLPREIYRVPSLWPQVFTLNNY